MKRTLSFVALLLLLVFLTGAYLATTVPEDDALIQPMGDALDKELSQTLNTIAENKEFAGFEELTQDTDLRNYLNTRIFEKASRSIRIDTGLFTSGIYINNAASDCIVKGIAGHVIIKDKLPVAARVIVNETLSSDIPDEADHRRLLSSWISQAINNLTADAVKAYPPELQVMMSGFVEQVKAENISMGSRAINNMLKFETGNGYSMLYGSGKDGIKEVMSLGIAGRIYETPALKKVKSETEAHFKKLLNK